MEKLAYSFWSFLHKIPFFDVIWSQHVKKWSSALTLFFVFIFSFLFLTPAYAQTDDQELRNEPAIRVDTPLPDKGSPPSTVPPFARPEAVFSDPGGMTSWLRRRGIAFLFANTNEFAGAITKPARGEKFRTYRQGASNAGQYAASLNIDWEMLAGLKGLATHMITTGRYGTTANRMFGDWLNHSSEDYGGAGNVAVHLVMLYAEENLFGNRLAIAGGRMAELSDFAASELFCNFMNGSICGRPKGISDSSYYPGYPAATWAFRVRGRPTRDVYVQTGVYFAEDGIYQVAQHRTGFKFNGANIVGHVVPVEVGWEPRAGRSHSLPGHYKIGAALQDVSVADTYRDTSGKPYVLTGAQPARRQYSWSSWLMLDQQLLRYRKSQKNSGITALGGLIYNDPHTALRDYEIYGALINRGFWRNRPYDTIGIAFSYTHIAKNVQKTEALLQSQNQTMINHATGIQRHTSVLEVNYAIHVMRGVIFQPVFEYYFRPNGQGNLPDAAMLGFKSHIEIF